jgi:hypothetical protein
MNRTTIEQARAAKVRAKEIFSSKVSVAGVGITEIDGGYGIKVNLREAPTPGTHLPAHLDGVPICIEVVGHLRKQ